ncbi:Nuclear aminoacylation-dependent tRNA export pathway component [Microbotryomycetes sp. JL201]|nr:Nuclear aminoacylation-dependent tRNA export pathway component [Microbotryomycetes sp. JL201]
MASWLSSLSSAVINAGASALSGSSGIPGVQGYTLGERVTQFDNRTIWTLYSGTRKQADLNAQRGPVEQEDSSQVSVFSFDTNTPAQAYSSGADRKQQMVLARNALRKLRALKHPHILRFLDGSETDSSVWIITEPVASLTAKLRDPKAMTDESKVYGLLHLATALSFLNKDGTSIHANLRHESIWLTQGGEWKLGGMEVLTRKEEDSGVLYTHGGIVQDSRVYASPEVRKSGWTALKEQDASALDSYQLHLLIHTLFNGPLPPTFGSSSDTPPTLPTTRGSIPAQLFQAWRRLGNPNPKARLKTDVFLELGMGSESAGGGWWPTNRLVKLSAALEGYSLASESEKLGLARTLQLALDGKGAANALPEDFVKYKVLPSLVRTFEFGGGGPALLPLILSLGSTLPEKEYGSVVVQPLVRMFALPDRAMRMALIEHLDKFIDKVTQKDVVDKVWPHLLTGFTDVVPVIREATVKSVLLIAPKLNDKILNNDLLRHLAKTQTDPEPGIRTNTCILLGRLSKHLQVSTSRKVLVPAFARALRDPFIHARIAGLMALMATADVYEKEDLAGKVIPAMSICLIDKEKAVRDQGFKAIDMFVKKCEQLTAHMPETVVVENGASSPAAQAASQTQPGLATNAAGAAGALAGWAFASVSKKLSSAELQAPIERRPSTPGHTPSATPNPNALSGVASSAPVTPSLQVPGGFSGNASETEDWGGDLMDVNDDEGDWDEFESGQAAPPRVDPLAARLSSAKPKTSTKKGGALKLGAPSRSSALRIPMDMDAGDSWDIDGDPFDEKPTQKPMKPLVRATPVARNTPIVRTTAATPQKPAAPVVPKSTIPTSESASGGPMRQAPRQVSPAPTHVRQPSNASQTPSTPPRSSPLRSPASPDRQDTTRTTTSLVGHQSFAEDNPWSDSPGRSSTPSFDQTRPTNVHDQDMSQSSPVPELVAEHTPSVSTMSIKADDKSAEEATRAPTEDKAAKLARARAERQARMAKLRQAKG